MQVVEVVPVLDTNAYADNDVLFVPVVVPGMTNAPRRLVSVGILDEADQGQDIDLVFTEGTVTLGTINAAVNISDSDARKIVGVVSVVQADYSDLVNSQYATKRGIDLLMLPRTQLYVSGVLRSGTPTYGASSIRLRLGFEE